MLISYASGSSYTCQSSGLVSSSKVIHFGPCLLVGWYLIGNSGVSIYNSKSLDRPGPEVFRITKDFPAQNQLVGVLFTEGLTIRVSNPSVECFILYVPIPRGT